MSWIAVAAGHPFPIQNLPIGVFSSHSRNHLERRICVAIGDYVLDLKAIHYAGLLDDLGFDSRVFRSSNLNSYMALDKSCWRATRACITSLLSDCSDDKRLKDNHILQQESIFPTSEIDMHLPAEIGDYTDFYSSREHATNVGIMFRGVENALQPNWLHLPVGYHGRASSIVVSGTEVTRPCGQLQDPKSVSILGPTKQMDFELEMAFFIGGKANALGKPVTMVEAEDRIFGVVLMNDWSARDVQAWEYVPLGPFTAKNFCTSISPWVVSMDALEPFRCAPSVGPVQNPPPLSYLSDPEFDRCAFDVKLQVSITPHTEDNIKELGKRDDLGSACVVSNSNMKNLYWNSKQQLVHHSVSGCPMKPGDLLGTGTISGPTDSSMGSMLELSWKGSRDVPLTQGLGGEEDGGESVNKMEESGSEKEGGVGSVGVRRFLEDGDTVTITGQTDMLYEKDEGVGGVGRGYRIGFGSVSGKILPAISQSYFTSLPPPSGQVQSIPSKDERVIHHSLSTESVPGSMHPRYSNYRLFSYWRSTCSWRVRIAMAMKGIPYEYVPVDILARYTGTPSKPISLDPDAPRIISSEALPNPLHQVPVLEFKSILTGEIIRLTQSLAIIEFLDEMYPSKIPLLPQDPIVRARVRQVSEIVTSGIQPLQSIGIIRELTHFQTDSTSGDGQAYAKLKCEDGLRALETLLCSLRTPALARTRSTDKPCSVFAVGTSHPTVADLCVVPQLYNARVRFGLNVDRSTHPHLYDVDEACASLPAFETAVPSNQPDAL